MRSWREMHIPCFLLALVMLAAGGSNGCGNPDSSQPDTQTKADIRQNDDFGAPDLSTSDSQSQDVFQSDRIQHVDELEPEDYQEPNETDEAITDLLPTGDLAGELVCNPDCSSVECGMDPVCGTQNCGTCPENHECLSGQCVCVPDCSGVECGLDPVCGTRNCGTCFFYHECSSGQCVCVPDCSGVECGLDPVCGTQNCGTCPENHECSSGQCVCVPDCSGAKCGLDPVCGTQNCGTCPDNHECSSGQCVCVPDCSGVECGLDPVCGTQNCGTCSEHQLCKLRHCVSDMVQIPAGDFWMGCDSSTWSDCDPSEMPYQTITMPGFYIDRAEVTVYDYQRCVAAGECKSTQTESPACNLWQTGKGDHPVNCVTWSQANQYCEYAGKRLPTEAEWEKAARWSDGRIFPWGNETATCRNAVMYSQLLGCGAGGTLPVCQKSPYGDSFHGLCDMAGNVSEWVSDWFDYDYYDDTPGVDPQGPATGDYKIRRGGSFVSGADDLTTFGRRVQVPDETYEDYVFDLGFRCAISQECEPDCSNRECGADPVCNQSCGICLGSGTCRSGQCVCVPDCSGIECGIDPVCGQSCGTCDIEADCRAGKCVDENRMAYIPPGEFTMGCIDAFGLECDSREQPAHNVTISAFYIDLTETTVQEYRACVQAQACNEPAEFGGDPYCNWSNVNRETHPINCLSWEQARDYCHWKGKRLPTEAEWEKAARGTDLRVYPWGNTSPTCQYSVMFENDISGCGNDGTMPVCSKSPDGDSPYGACDMAGNVWEMVSDWYGASYYSTSPNVNPTGPVSGTSKVVRGGGFYDQEYGLWTTTRITLPMTSKGTINTGMRCAMDEVCTPTCGERNCGNNGCGGTCGFCDAGFTCTDDGFCEHD